MIKTLIEKSLGRLGLKICRIPSIRSEEPNPIHLWNENEQFNNIWAQLDGITIVDKVRCFMIFQLACQASKIAGDIAEVGVYKGGTAKLLGKIFESSSKTIHLFDTFSGMPSTDPKKDLVKEGDFGDTSLESVKQYLGDFENILLYQGLFPETAKSIENKSFCLVHVDVDIYRSVMDCCDFFYQRLVRGGIIIFDDYGYITCPGAKKAIDEFFLRKPEYPCYLPTGQCLAIKI
jgi:O-methyltransferase